MSPLVTSYSQSKSLYQVLLSNPTVVKLQGVTSWVYLPRIKPVSTDMLQEPEDPHPSYSREPAQDLKYLFKKVIPKPSDNCIDK